MPKFSQESFSELSTCHLELQTLFYEVVRHFDCKVIKGHRGEAEQNEAYNSGQTKLKWPDGKHNSQPSMAADVAPYPIDWRDAKKFYYFGGFVLGIAERLKAEGKMTYSVRWGGDWDKDNDLSDQTFNDLVHFELV